MTGLQVVCRASTELRPYAQVSLGTPAGPNYHAPMPTRSTIASLSRRFAGQTTTRFEPGPGGLVRAVIHATDADALVYLHGVHVAAFRPAGFTDVLYMSPSSAYDPAKPLRGGVPVIFPWFGPRIADPTSPPHGFARLKPWELQSVSTSGQGAVELSFGLSDSPVTRETWNHRFNLTFRVTIGPALGMSLTVKNTSPHEWTFDEALHTYLAVSDARQVAVQGLDGATFIDRTDKLARKTQPPGGIRFTAETDRLYVNTPAACVLQDPVARREIVVEKEHSNSTIIWNPWPDKARTLTDLGDGQWTSFVCVESGNAGENAITLAPAASHTMSVRISARALAA
jgi:glucose-6-phosphate 1-epimerase